MKIKIETIPHSKQRYETCGDYWINSDTAEIRVSDLKNNDYEFLIVIHELIEFYLTEKRGITEESISEFDIKFEKERLEGLHSETDEPGWDKNAPYRNEHIFAEIIERQIAKELGVDWQDYDKAVNEL